MARKPSAATHTPLPDVNQDAYREEATALAVIAQQADTDDLRGAHLIGERIGRRSMGRMVQKLVTVTDLLDLQNIKESNKYKGLVVVDADGNRQRITTWAEYCSVVEGKSREAIDLDLQNLNQLGAELFDSMRQVGIGPGKMRELRKLPEDQQAVLHEATGQLMAFYSENTEASTTLAAIQAGLEELAWHKGNVQQHAHPQLELGEQQ